MATRHNALNATESQAASIVARLPSLQEQAATSHEALEAKFDGIESYIAEKAIEGFGKADNALAESCAAMALNIGLAYLRKETFGLPIDKDTPVLAVNRVLTIMALKGYMIYKNGRKPNADKKAKPELLSDSRDAVNAIAAKSQEGTTAEEKAAAKVEAMNMATAYVKDFSTTTGKIGKKGPYTFRQYTTTVFDLVQCATGLAEQMRTDDESRKLAAEIASLPRMTKEAIERWNNFLFGRHNTRTFSGLVASLEASEIMKATAEAKPEGDKPEGDATGNESGNATGPDNASGKEVSPLEFLATEAAGMSPELFGQFSAAFDIFTNSPSGVVDMLKKYLPAFSSLNGFNLVALKAILATEADKKAATVAATVEDAPKPEDKPVVDAEYTEAKPEGETLPVVQSAA